jgi:hypothetical protein
MEDAPPLDHVATGDRGGNDVWEHGSSDEFSGQQREDGRRESQSELCPDTFASTRRRTLAGGHWRSLPNSG